MGRKRIGDGLDIETLVEEYIRTCICGGEPPLVKHLAATLGLTPVTLYRRYLEATGRGLSDVLRERHGEHLRQIASIAHCLEHVAEAGGYSCGRSVRRRLKAIGARVGVGAG